MLGCTEPKDEEPKYIIINWNLTPHIPSLAPMKNTTKTDRKRNDKPERK